MANKSSKINLAGFLKAVGVLLLLIGGMASYLAPYEIYAFYLFSEGGKFYYPGFGFGSFMFANITAQVAIYYLLAMIFLPLGYGHLFLRSWARQLAATLLRCWLVIGLPLAIVLAFMLLSVKNMPLWIGVLVLILLGLSYFLFPWLLILFYDSRAVRAAFSAHSTEINPLDQRPIQTLVLTFLLGFYALLAHSALFLNGIFPWFGKWLNGEEGFQVLGVCILLLFLFAWGFWMKYRWAWWGALLLMTTLTTTLLMTLIQASYSEILNIMNIPPKELEFIGGIPLHGWNLAFFIGIPSLLTIILILKMRISEFQVLFSRGFKRN